MSPSSSTPSSSFPLYLVLVLAVVVVSDPRSYPQVVNICVGAIANRGQWEQGCRLFIATDLGPVRATSKKKKQKKTYWASPKKGQVKAT